MKSVLISIQPKWVEKIASGEKTIEVRKTRPKLGTPFKCYIYCTKDKTFAEKTLRGFDENGKAIYYKANKGKVIGEFVCDRIAGDGETIRGNACLTVEEIQDYCNGKDIYLWHISDLKIYDKPKELSGFTPICKYKGERCEICCFNEEAFGGCCRSLTRPPQSWCYVEVE